VTLHTETDIYRAVSDLGKFVADAMVHLRRDLKPSYGRLLAEESVLMAVNVREANIAVDGAKVPILEEVLRQVEAMQFTFRVLREGKHLPNNWAANSIPFTTMVARQATALKNRYVPAPSPVA
jgi:hypothetical protein